MEEVVTNFSALLILQLIHELS